MASPSSDEVSASMLQLPWFVAGSQALGIGCVVLVGIWMGHYRGGFSWNRDVLEFNVHPLCMILGMVFLYGDAIMVYRIFRQESKKCIKIVHAVVHLGALLTTIIGLVAVFHFHDAKSIPNLYSLHSWLGLTTVVMFGLQWVIGFLIFLYPAGLAALRAWYLPLHTFFGLAIFILAIASSLTGMTEKLLFVLSDTYHNMPVEAMLANSLGLLVVAFSVVVGYIVTRPEWKRPSQAEEEALSMHFHRITRGDDEDD
uniref:transmembrane ascorbate-dependent reductase CYB561-like n=1 Tax=Myxine glutinosa TaxID=7769 RepID=UPI00359023C7